MALSRVDLPRAVGADEADGLAPGAVKETRARRAPGARLARALEPLLEHAAAGSQAEAALPLPVPAPLTAVVDDVQFVRDDRRPPLVLLLLSYGRTFLRLPEAF